MTAALVLTIGALILGFAAIAQLVPSRPAEAAERGDPQTRSPLAWSLLRVADGRLGL